MGENGVHNGNGHSNGHSNGKLTARIVVLLDERGLGGFLSPPAREELRLLENLHSRSSAELFAYAISDMQMMRSRAVIDAAKSMEKGEQIAPIPELNIPGDLYTAVVNMYSQQ